MRATEPLLACVEKTIQEQQLSEADSPILLMVSGGSDSTAMAYVVADLKEKGLLNDFAMLHVNHQIRGEDADNDQVFVQELATALNIPLFICEIDIPGEVKRTGENIEAVARRERYLAADMSLESYCRHKATPLSEGRIFTAHTRNDRVENFYMRSIVGTGPGGFRSMLYRNGPVVRPFLDIDREELRNYIIEREKASGVVVADREGNLWREDATNAHTDRFRSYIRHEIVPRMKEKNPQLIETLCRTMNLIADEDDMLENMADKIEKRCIKWLELDENQSHNYAEGCLFAPAFGAEEMPLQRRVCANILNKILGPDARPETASIEAIVAAFDNEGKPVGGYTGNLQGNLALSANKQGVRLEPMARYRARRKKDR